LSFLHFYQYYLTFLNIRQNTHSVRGLERSAYRAVVETLERKRPLGRYTHRWEDIVKISLKEIGWKNVDWIQSSKVRD
jgi:hypothetical protein